MTDSRTLGTGAFGPEPTHDPELGALMRDIVGDVPHAGVDWTALAARIGERVGIQMPAPWWSYAARWERHVIALALAAGIAAAAVLSMSTSSATGSAASPLTSASALATAVASGTPAEDAAAQFARSITNAADLSAGIPE